MGKVSIIIIGIVAALAIALFGSYVSNYNFGNRSEKTITAEYKNMENILGQYSLKVAEAAQVPTMMKNDLVEVVKAAIQGRYGADGSKATFQWLQEQNPTMDPTLYKNIQRLIEAGRNKFENAQTKFIDTKRQYETALGNFWQGTMLGFAGYPKIDLDDYKIISSEHASTTFATSIDTGLKLIK